MINYVVPHDQRYTFGDYLVQNGRALQEHVMVRSYEQLLADEALPGGAYVFAAIDQLTPAERRLAARMWATLDAAGRGAHLLNNPERVRCRYELLCAAHAHGANGFRVCRASAVADDLRYPVFVRLEREHTGSLTKLLPDRRALRLALAELMLRGYRRRDLLVAEYCDTADTVGHLRKYAAYNVGGEIIPCALVVSSDWMTKNRMRRLDEATAREELAYVLENPHEAWIREMFALARIDYGRIDYALRDGKPQMWEINMNPMIGRRIGGANRWTEEQRQLRAPARDHVAARFQAAWSTLDSGSSRAAAIAFPVSAAERRRVQVERRRAARVVGRRDFIDRFARAPGFVAMRKLWRAVSPSPMWREGDARAG